jgi:EmrB/QacA subfamily drug resistance transporter
LIKQDQAHGPSQAKAKQTAAIAGLSLSMLMASLDSSIANAGLPAIAKALGASFASAQWVVLSYLLTVTALVVSVGRLGDLVGRKRLLLAGIAVFTGASAVCGFAPNLWALLAGRVAQGFGAAVMMSLTLAFVSGTVRTERTGSVMGLLGTMSALGTALGPSLGGIMISHYGWHSLFLVNLPIGLLSLLLAFRNLPRDREGQQGARFDTVGTVLLAVGLGTYALALTLGHGAFRLLNGVLLTTSATAIAAFVRSQRRGSSPLLRLELLREPGLREGLVLSGLVSTILMTTLVVGPFYLARSLAFDPATVGVILSIGPAVVAVSGIPAGRLADRIGAARLAPIGLAVIGAGALLLAVLPRSFGVTGYVLAIVVITAGYAAFQTSNNSSVLAGVDSERRGVVSGMLNLARNLGLVTGASAMGALFAWASGGAVLSASPDAVSTGMRITFAVAAALVAAGLMIRRWSSSRGDLRPTVTIGILPAHASRAE